MKSFDERAEARAERRARPHGGPSQREIHAVQVALASRTRQLDADLSTVDVFLRLGGTGDAEEGPPEANSAASQLLIERFEKVAAQLRKVRDAVTAVDFDAGDKEKLRTSLKEAALSWDARATMAKATEKTAIEAALAAIGQHEARAASYMKALRPYFKVEEEEDE
jgi:hypothetical protein